jgi:hypothetical protein
MIPELHIPNDKSIFQSALMDSSLIPRFPLQLDDSVALLPMEVRDDGIVGGKLSPTVSRFPNHSRGPVVVPVGTRTGDSRIRVSLSSRGGPIKVLGSVNPTNRLKILNQCPQ